MDTATLEQYRPLLRPAGILAFGALLGFGLGALTFKSDRGRYTWQKYHDRPAVFDTQTGVLYWRALDGGGNSMRKCVDFVEGEEATYAYVKQEK